MSEAFIPALPGTVLHVLAWGPQSGKLLPTERPTTAALPVLGWRDLGRAVEPNVGGPVGHVLALALAPIEVVDYRAAIEVDGTVYDYDVPGRRFFGTSFASLAEWHEDAGVKDPMAGLSKKEWDKAVKANREQEAPLLTALYDMRAITIPAPTPAPMTPSPLPSERPVPAPKPGSIPGPGMVEETPEEIAEARRNMAALREGGFAQTAPLAEEDDAASLV